MISPNMAAKVDSHPRSGGALTWVLVSVILLCIAGGGLLYWQTHRHHDIKLQGPTETIDLGKGVKLELVRINPGDFLMGSPDSEPDHDPSEAPVHKVSIK